MSFAGKNVLITGGTTGIGFAIIEVIARDADNIAVLDIVATSEEFAGLCSNHPNIIFIQTDVADKSQVNKSFQEALTRFKFIDIVICNAGVLDETDYERTINVNLLGLMHTTYAAIDFMSTAKGGRGGLVANVASVVGLDAVFSTPAYAASKHGVIGLTRCFGDDFYYQKHGIKFIAICPGITETGFIADVGPRLYSLDAVEGNEKATAAQAVQTAAAVGKCFAEILSLEKNGTIWLIDGGEYKEVVLTKYWLK